LEKLFFSGVSPEATATIGAIGHHHFSPFSKVLTSIKILYEQKKVLMRGVFEKNS